MINIALGVMRLHLLANALALLFRWLVITKRGELRFLNMFNLKCQIAFDPNRPHQY